MSGFLITSLLLDELRRTGCLALPPVLGPAGPPPAAGVGVGHRRHAGRRRVVLDPLRASDLARDARPAALFVINIVFARRQSDYLTADRPRRPCSTSGRWPGGAVLPGVAGAAAAGGRLPPPLHAPAVAGPGRRAVAAVVRRLRPAHRQQPAMGLLRLPTRAWELLTGAGLALVRRLGRAGTGGPALSSSGGRAWSHDRRTAVVYGATTRFPGPAAVVPGAGHGGVIAAGPALALGPVRACCGWRPLHLDRAGAPTASTSGTGRPSSWSPPRSAR